MGTQWAQMGKSFTFIIIYLYSEGTHDSAERTVSPFKAISASQVIQIAHSGSINDIADNAKITADD